MKTQKMPNGLEFLRPKQVMELTPAMDRSYFVAVGEDGDFRTCVGQIAYYKGSYYLYQGMNDGTKMPGVDPFAKKHRFGWSLADGSADNLYMEDIIYFGIITETEYNKVLNSFPITMMYSMTNIVIVLRLDARQYTWKTYMK
jgi:hypothetical protein